MVFSDTVYLKSVIYDMFLNNIYIYDFFTFCMTNFMILSAIFVITVRRAEPSQLVFQATVSRTEPEPARFPATVSRAEPSRLVFLQL